MTGMRAWTSAAVLAVMLTASAAGLADEKKACFAASEKAQQLRNDGKLIAARDTLAECQKPTCPKFVQQDCAQWTSEVLKLLPSIVPAAKDPKGRDLVDVKVFLDGALVSERLDGKPIDVDPGVHQVRFEGKDTPVVEERVVARQGEQSRIVSVTLGKPASSDPWTPPPKGEEGGSSAPVLAYVVGGLGIAALATALVIDLGANSDARELRDTCAPRCAQDRVDAVEQKYLIAGITAGVGGALLIGGAVLFFTHKGSKPAKASALRLTPRGLEF